MKKEGFESESTPDFCPFNKIEEFGYIEPEVVACIVIVVLIGFILSC